MIRIVNLAAAAALGAALVLSWGASAETVRHHPRHHAVAQGHEITVHARESFLTAGTGASVGAYSGYALDTISAQSYMPTIDHTFVGQPGLDRLPNNFTVPGCCVP
jgi:hypothetical protein